MSEQLAREQVSRLEAAARAFVERTLLAELDKAVAALAKRLEALAAQARAAASAAGAARRDHSVHANHRAQSGANALPFSLPEVVARAVTLGASLAALAPADPLQELVRRSARTASPVAHMADTHRAGALPTRPRCSSRRPTRRCTARAASS